MHQIRRGCAGAEHGCYQSLILLPSLEIFNLTKNKERRVKRVVHFRGMKRQEELKAVLIVVCFFALSILVLLFILKCDDIVDYCRNKVSKPATVVCLISACFY